MRKAAPTRSDYARVIADRDGVIADRDYLLGVLKDLAMSTDINVIATQLAAIRAMVSNAPFAARTKAGVRGV